MRLYWIELKRLDLRRESKSEVAAAQVIGKWPQVFKRRSEAQASVVVDSNRGAGRARRIVRTGNIVDKPHRISVVQRTRICVCDQHKPFAIALHRIGNS